MLYAFLVAAIVIFIAEQGDKTQILAFALATRLKAWQVLLGIVLVNLVMLLVFALAGRLVGSFLPEFWIWVVSGVALIAFGIQSLVSRDDEAADVEEAREAEHDRPKEHKPPVFGAAGASAERAPAREGAPDCLRHGHEQRSSLAGIPISPSFSRSRRVIPSFPGSGKPRGRFGTT